MKMMQMTKEEKRRLETELRLLRIERALEKQTEINSEITKCLDAAADNQTALRGIVEKMVSLAGAK